jgi:predicted transcriptional regulator
VRVRGFGELEAAIMDRLWTRGAPATVREVLIDLQQERWLRREPDGRAFRYAPTVSRAEYGARQLRNALDNAGDPAEALLRFVGRMSADEAAVLRRALAAHEQGGPR